MTKRERQNRIIELISEREIDTQDELTSILASEGIKATQATVSRDINELKISKIPTGDGRQ